MIQLRLKERGRVHQKGDGSVLARGADLNKQKERRLRRGKRGLEENRKLLSQNFQGLRKKKNEGTRMTRKGEVVIRGDARRPIERELIDKAQVNGRNTLSSKKRSLRQGGEGLLLPTEAPTV